MIQHHVQLLILRTEIPSGGCGFITAGVIFICFIMGFFTLSINPHGQEKPLMHASSTSVKVMTDIIDFQLHVPIKLMNGLPLLSLN